MFQEYQQPSSPQLQLLSVFESQKHICSQYIKLAQHRLYPQEAQAISQANSLLEQLGHRQKSVKDLSEWDVFSTRDSVILEDESSINLSNYSQQSRGKHIQRKTARCVRNTRQLEGSMADCLAEVQEQCSVNTLSTVKRMSEEYRKLKMKVYECQKKQKGMRVQQKMIEDLQQRNVILSRKIEDADHAINKLKSDNSTLKATNSELNQLLLKKDEEMNCDRKNKVFEEIVSHHSSSSLKTHSASRNQSYDILSEVMREKQLNINLRYDKVREIEKEVERQLFGLDGGCGGCCQVLRRLKGSIVNYKRYLQGEGHQFDRLVDNFRNKTSEFDSQQY